MDQHGETYLATTSGDTARLLEESGALYLLNTAVLHPIDVELQLRTDSAGDIASLELVRHPDPYTDDEHEHGLVRLSGFGTLAKAWRGLQAAAERLGLRMVAERPIRPGRDP